ncbi:MAG: glucose sorbosone dehydrogenase [Rhodopirellula sp.]|nr:glucose sorbosone dehydrogenase [Rhodopirellula sp.]OUX50691.1 MAG: glucose sorbosone dehydrogenase [Rhodopirellula sp. TMED283]
MKFRLCLLLVGLTIIQSAALLGQSTVNLAEPPTALNTNPLPVKVVDAYPRLRVERPIVLTGAGDGSGRLFIAGQRGKIFFIDASDQDVQRPTLFGDLSKRVSYKDRENEEGLLGFTFHPQFKKNGYLFVYYTTRERPHTSVISRFSAIAGKTVDLGSEVKLLEIQQPFWNHNGGTIVFGPDGYLYIALGDGGKANDPLGSGQDVSTLLGSVLRIDVDKTSGEIPYAIPSDNPLVGKPETRPEIYAFGIRNIWRMAFDQMTGDLWAADVGQNEWEEINLIRAGGNYGWNLREAAHAFKLAGGPGSGPNAELSEPIVEYPHTEAWGKSITGGAVYRGSQTPILDGYYLYGDYISGRIWALKYDSARSTVAENRPIIWDNLPVFTFGQTDDGEVLMSTMSGGGRIFRFAQ